MPSISGDRKVIKRNHLYPRTSTRPIQLSEYVERERRTVLMDRDTLNPEFVQWHERQMRKGNHE